MSSPNQLSFLPEDYLDRKAQRRTNVICAVLAVIVMGAIGSAFSLTERMIGDAERKNQQVDQQYAEAARQIQQVREMEMKQRRMARQADLAASLLEKIPRSNIVACVTNYAGDSQVSWLNFSMTSQRLTTPAAPAPAANEKKPAVDELPTAEPIVYNVTIKVTGVASNDLQVADFIRRLNHCPLFKDVNLVVSDAFEKDEQKFRRFEVVMTINNDVDVKNLDVHETALDSGGGASNSTSATADPSAK